MTRRRWIADEVKGNTAALVGEHASHLSRVLRAQIGQEFDISTATGVRRGKIVSVSDSRVEFALGAEISAAPSPRLTLVLAIFKFDRMEWGIEKCTEIGVSRIIPLVTRRTHARLATAAVKRRERWERIARQASEQSRRVAPPEIAPPITLARLSTALVADGTPALSARIVLAESDQNTMLRDVMDREYRLEAGLKARKSCEEAGRNARPSHAECALAVGPEGGWTDDELDWFRKSGWAFASLGNTILRAETAAIVASAIALDCLR